MPDRPGSKITKSKVQRCVPDKSISGLSQVPAWGPRACLVAMEYGVVHYSTYLADISVLQMRDVTFSEFVKKFILFFILLDEK